MKRLVLEEMIWPEVEAALPEIKVAVIPVGSCEQHGPNGTFVVDTVRAYEMSKLLAERCGEKILVYPPVTYGYSAHHLPFPGSATLRINTLTAVLVDIALSVTQQGIDKVLFVNGHGGNNPSLMSAVQILKYEHKVSAFWASCYTRNRKLYFPDLDMSFSGHACEVEMSQTMYLRPDIVRDEREKGIKQLSIFNDCDDFVPGTQGVWNWKNDMTLNGCQGDARRATPEIGKAICEEALEYLTELVDKIISHQPT